MTNEQLAELIGEGGNDELRPLLWEKMRKLYRMWTDKYYSSHKERCDLCGVSADDLRQEAYLSMLEAVKAYNSRTDEHKDSLFTSYCLYPFKNHAAELIGMRTQRGRNEALNCIHSSLDEPLTDKDGDTSATISDIIPDQEAEQPFRDVEQTDYCRFIRETVAEVLKDNPKELEVIERIYYNGETLSNIAADMEVSIERIRQIKNAALRELRKSKRMRAFQEISCYRHINFDSFSRHGSVEEQIIEQRERFERFIKENYEYIHNKGGANE